MTLEQRKIELISWIARLENESILNTLESMKDVGTEKIPNEILALLNQSNQIEFDELTEHTSARDLILNS